MTNSDNFENKNNENVNIEKAYQSASDEQPSENTDRLILKAAADALVKEKSSSRRWHMPVSIAAGAVFTITIVISLDPWSDSTFDTAMTMDYEQDERIPTTLSEKVNPEPVVSELRFQLQSPPPSKARSDSDAFSLDSSNDGVDSEVNFEEESQVYAKKRQLLKQKQRAKVESVESNKALHSQEEKIAAELVSIKPIIAQEHVTAFINDQIAIIEFYSSSNKLDLAKKHLDIFTKRYYFESLSNDQQLRIQSLKDKLYP